MGVNPNYLLNDIYHKLKCKDIKIMSSGFALICIKRMRFKKISYWKKCKCQISELKEMRCLGVGVFSRVHLVENINDGKLYALKKMKKNVIVKSNQQKHVQNDKKIITLL